MRDANESAWWEETWRFAAALGAGIGGLSLVFVALAKQLDGRLVLGVPLGTFLAAVGIPVLVLAVIFIFAGLQQALDRRYDVSED